MDEMKNHRGQEIPRKKWHQVYISGQDFLFLQCYEVIMSFSAFFEKLAEKYALVGMNYRY